MFVRLVWGLKDQVNDKEIIVDLVVYRGVDE